LKLDFEEVEGMLGLIEGRGEEAVDASGESFDFDGVEGVVVGSAVWEELIEAFGECLEKSAPILRV
jgi:hypothetical protein